MKSKIYIFCTLILMISGKQEAFAESNFTYKYPDLNKNIIGMQPIIEDEDINPKGRRILKSELRKPDEIKKAAKLDEKKPIISPVVPPSIITAETIEKKANISIVITSSFTTKEIKEYKDLNDYIRTLKQNVSKNIKVHSVGIIGDDNSISSAKRRALSHALLLRQYLIDKNISSTRIDMNIEAVKASSANNDFIEIY